VLEQAAPKLVKSYSDLEKKSGKDVVKANLLKVKLKSEKQK
jgi:hypothetical protein